MLGKQLKERQQQPQLLQTNPATPPLLHHRRHLQLQPKDWLNMLIRRSSLRLQNKRQQLQLFHKLFSTLLLLSVSIQVFNRWAMILNQHSSKRSHLSCNQHRKALRMLSWPLLPPLLLLNSRYLLRFQFRSLSRVQAHPKMFKWPLFPPLPLCRPPQTWLLDLLRSAQARSLLHLLQHRQHKRLVHLCKRCRSTKLINWLLLYLRPLRLHPHAVNHRNPCANSSWKDAAIAGSNADFLVRPPLSWFDNSLCVVFDQIRKWMLTRVASWRLKTMMRKKSRHLRKCWKVQPWFRILVHSDPNCLLVNSSTWEEQCSWSWWRQNHDGLCRMERQVNWLIDLINISLLIQSFVRYYFLKMGLDKSNKQHEPELKRWESTSFAWSRSMTVCGVLQAVSLVCWRFMLGDALLLSRMRFMELVLSIPLRSYGQSVHESKLIE